MITNVFLWIPKTFEQIPLKKGLLGEKLKLLTENLEVTISFLEEKPLSIDLPNNIDCIVESTEGVVKGQTCSFFV
jgi:elongation factor P